MKSATKSVFNKHFKFIVLDRVELSLVVRVLWIDRLYVIICLFDQFDLALNLFALALALGAGSVRLEEASTRRRTYDDTFKIGNRL